MKQLWYSSETLQTFDAEIHHVRLRKCAGDDRLEVIKIWVMHFIYKSTQSPQLLRKTFKLSSHLEHKTWTQKSPRTSASFLILILPICLMQNYINAHPSFTKYTARNLLTASEIWIKYAKISKIVFVELCMKLIWLLINSACISPRLFAMCQRQCSDRSSFWKFAVGSFPLIAVSTN